MRALSAVAAVCALALPHAQAEPACTSHACSNDARGVLGDETLAWDAPSGTVTHYEVCTANESACVTTVGTSLLVSGTSLDAIGYEGGLKVRACNCSNPNLPCGCGGWSVVAVEFLPFICTNQQPAIPDNHGGTTNPACEWHCYPSSPLRSTQTPCP